MEKEKKKILIIDASNFIEFRCVRFLKEKYEVQIVISPAAINNIMALHKEGLDYFDFIFMEPYFPNGKYGYIETDENVQTGWFLYRDLMRDLKNAKIIIISYFTDRYSYSKSNYPERKWGENVVGIRRKNGEDDQLLIDMVETYSAKYLHGRTYSFAELPVGKKFIYPDVYQKLLDEAPYDDEAPYEEYYIKISPEKGRVCMASGENADARLGQEFEVVPKKPVVFLNIEHP